MLSLTNCSEAESVTKSIVCHIGDPRQSKPATLAEYGKLREQMIQRDWACLSEQDFIARVTEQGCPFYGALMNGRDLMELQFEKLCWRSQSLVGLDFDDVEFDVQTVTQWFAKIRNIPPWLVYHTFSHEGGTGVNSFRVLWRAEIDLNLSYDQMAAALKVLRGLSCDFADKHAANPTRMWQGTLSGAAFYDPQAPELNIRNLLQ